MTTEELIFSTKKISTVLLYVMIGALAAIIAISTDAWLVKWTASISFSCLFLFVSTMYFGRLIIAKNEEEMVSKHYHTSGICLIMAACALAIFHFVNAYTITNNQTVSLTTIGLVAIPGILLFCYNFFIILVGVLYQRNTI